MNGKQLPGTRRRRSHAEVEGLVAEYEASGLGRQTFCNRHGLSLSTLNRHGKRQHMASKPAETSRWVAVELSDYEHPVATSALHACRKLHLIPRQPGEHVLGCRS